MHTTGTSRSHNPFPRNAYSVSHLGATTRKTNNKRRSTPPPRPRPPAPLPVFRNTITGRANSTTTPENYNNARHRPVTWGTRSFSGDRSAANSTVHSKLKTHLFRRRKYAGRNFNSRLARTSSIRNTKFYNFYTPVVSGAGRTT